ncbi:MAG TPA: hypothetical protein VFX50_06160 [Gemmatimonadales bacterium]|nr:hypothetical protein [Gemmatimonadales bacterium]
MIGAPPGFVSAVVTASAWFWGGRLLASAFFAFGLPMTMVEGVSWAGAFAAAWVLSVLGGPTWRDAWRLLPAAALVALPEAVTVLFGRYTAASTLGLEVDGWGALAAVATRLLAVSLMLATLALLLAWARRQRLTTAAPRSPT